MLARLLLPGLLALLAGCTGTVDADPHSQERLRVAAAPLLDAHALLDAYHDAVADGDVEQARARWPDTAAQVQATVESYDVSVAADLGPPERSTLVGYVGGLRSALPLWERVDRAMRADVPQADVAGRVDTARAHMRILDGLRAAVRGDTTPAGTAPRG